MVQNGGFMLQNGRFMPQNYDTFPFFMESSNRVILLQS